MCAFSTCCTERGKSRGFLPRRYPQGVREAADLLQRRCGGYVGTQRVGRRKPVDIRLQLTGTPKRGEKTPEMKRVQNRDRHAATCECPSEPGGKQGTHSLAYTDYLVRQILSARKRAVGFDCSKLVLLDRCEILTEASSDPSLTHPYDTLVSGLLAIYRTKYAASTSQATELTQQDQPQGLYQNISTPNTLLCVI